MMSDLSFRVTVVPSAPIGEDKEYLLSRVKEAVLRCDLEVTTIGFFQVKKSEDDDYPELEELVIQVQAKAGISYPKQKALQYKEFCYRWEDIPGYPSYIVLYENDSFIRCRKSHHKDRYNDVSFGVLPHDGIFCQYANIKPIFPNSVDFYHDTRNVVIGWNGFEITFSYGNVKNIFVNTRKQRNEMFFDLFHPPLIFRMQNVRSQYGESYTLRHRNLNIKPPMSYGTGLINVDVLGRANVLSLRIQNSQVAEEIIASIHFRFSEKPIYFSNIETILKIKTTDPVMGSMHFGCVYLLTAIFKRNFVAVSQSSMDLSKLNALCNEDPDSLEKALTVVLAALDSGKIVNFWHAIESQYAYYLSNKDEINFKEYIIPSKCSLVRRITLTPTRQLLWPPEVMYGNRVLRNFDSEYSLRVSFRDDDMSRLSFIAMFADDRIFDYCITFPISFGLHIGQRSYDFLAWSNSQIRDHGVWVYAMDSQGKTACDIRRWMGDFSHIHNVPKYMARMGQCFSQTEDALSVPLDPKHVRTENDIEGGYDSVNCLPYCFSDGIGKISTNLAKKVHNTLEHDKLCSAFQIRYGGYKGMLVTDPTLKDADIVFRRSMKKFDSPENIRLEIAKTSAPIPLQLNRPFIALLNDLGVRHRTFLRLQEEMMKSLTDMLYKEKDAADFLRDKTPANLFNYQDLSESGIHLTTEPFFKSLLLALHRHHIENLKTRANIAIDSDKGRNMFGVLDETGILEYGQVFVQYTTDISYGETTKETTIVKGEVVVTKNPCLHPGDVRKFQAVDVPELRHIVDCIVFPQKGPRPHPNEMAGSDLDGDEYSVIWYKDLIFEGSNQTPADFPAVHSPDVRRIRVSDMINFLQNYIKNDQVGRIASAHLSHADKQSVFSEICLSIAKKFSVAVDFAKNGKSQQLERHEKPTESPDFMEKHHRGTYNSKKALGKLYRVCKDFESENEETSIIYQNVKVDPDLVYKGWENFKESAISSRNKYNGLFRSVLRNYGIQHEAEALSGAFTHLHSRFQERRDGNEIEKVVIGCVKKLHKSMLEEFLEEFHDSGNVDTTQEMMWQKASAWYVVTYSDPDAKFLSFPWTVSNYLSNIKISQTLGKISPFSPAIIHLDEKIAECDLKNLLPNIRNRIWDNCNFMCEPQVVKRAFRTLLLWAEDEEIIESTGRTHQGLISLDTFTKLFLHIAQVFKYITEGSQGQKSDKKDYSSGDICLEFLKYCSSFRFYNKYEIDQVLPFSIKKYNKIATCAVVTYHRFALSGKLRNLYFDKKLEKELMEMKPVQIDSKIFMSYPVIQDSLAKAEEALKKYSKVEEINLREIRQTKKVCVSARGSEMSLKNLKNILRKKHDVLRQLFSTGNMPTIT